MGEINYQETKARKDTTREQKIIRVAHERSSRRKLRAELEGPTSWNTGIPCEISTFQTGLTVCFASSKGFLACAWFFLRVKSDAMCWVWRVLRCVICCDKRAGDHHRQHPQADDDEMHGSRPHGHMLFLPPLLLKLKYFCSSASPFRLADHL